MQTSCPRTLRSGPLPRRPLDSWSAAYPKRKTSQLRSAPWMSAVRSPNANISCAKQSKSWSWPFSHCPEGRLQVQDHEPGPEEEGSERGPHNNVIYMYIYIYIYYDIYIYIYILYMYVYIYIYTHACVYLSLSIYIYR